jgi:di/tricarboxylate transporter
MTTEVKFVFGVIVVAAGLMASNRMRFDLIALLVVLALMLSGVLTVGEALSGFGSPVVILVAGLLVVGEMLNRTGAARAVGDFILKKGGSSETRLLVLIMIASAVLGGVMSSTAVVAIFIPIVLRIASETKLNASRLLLPMSYAALISGMLTLIATTPNIVVTEDLKEEGLTGFGFFSFTPIGLAVLAVAIVYILLLGRRMLPSEFSEDEGRHRKRSTRELWEAYRTTEEFDALRIDEGNALVGSTIGESVLHSRYGVRVIGILRALPRGKDRIATPAPETELHVRDVMLLVGTEESLARLREEQELKPVNFTDRERKRWLWELGSATVLIHPESRLVGKTLREIRFRSKFGMHVLGLRRAQEPVSGFERAELRVADSLLVAGPWSRIDAMQRYSHDFVVTELPHERAEIVQAYRMLPVSLVILALMIALTLFNIVPLVAAVIIAALAAVATRCLTMEDAYRSIHWGSVVLVAGMLPLADALDKTGGTDLVVRAILDAVGDSGPRVMLTVIFFLTALLGLFLSNTASAVLVSPIAIYAARSLDVSPYPFAVAVILAASAAFSTPVSTPVVTLVVEPGRYRFVDFMKVGVPLLLLTWLVTLLLAPIVFPFDGFQWE